MNTAFWATARFPAALTSPRSARLSYKYDYLRNPENAARSIAYRLITGDIVGVDPFDRLLLWVALSRTTDPMRVASNLRIFDFELNAAKMAAIHGLARASSRIFDPSGLAPVWDPTSSVNRQGGLASDP